MDNLVISAKKKITLDKFALTAKVSTHSEIKNILNVSAKSIIKSVEQANNVLTLSGKVFVNVIYSDNENKISSAETIVEFIEKQQVLTVLSNMVADDEVDVKVDTFSGCEILCSVTHNTNIYGVYSYEVPDFVSENTAFVLNKKSFDSSVFVSSCEDNFVVAEEMESNIKNMQVLSSSAKVITNEVSVAVDKVVVDGKIVVETIYSDDESITNVLIKEFDFKQEISANSVMPNMLAEAFVDVKNVTVTPEERQEKSNLVFVFDVFAKCYIYDKNTYEIAIDMFSLDSEVQNTYDYLELKNYNSFKTISDVIMSSTNVAEINNFDDIVGVYMPSFKILNVLEEETKDYIDAEINAFALYKSGEETKRLEVVSAVKLEVVKEEGDYLDYANILAEVSTFKVKAGKELEVAFKISGLINFSTRVSQSYIKSYEITDSKHVNEGGIKVYVTKEGETLYEVAKVLSVRPEVIAEQNEVDGVFEHGEKVYVYSPINLV